VSHIVHHLLSHYDSNEFLRVNQFFTRQVAYVAEKLDNIQEGERTALDNTMILYLSSMLHGNHDASQLPVALIGGWARMKTGRVLEYAKKPNRKMCSLYLALMDKLGVRLDTFGDSKERLAEI